MNRSGPRQPQWYLESQHLSVTADTFEAVLHRSDGAGDSVIELHGRDQQVGTLDRRVELYDATSRAIHEAGSEITAC